MRQLIYIAAILINNISMDVKAEYWDGGTAIYVPGEYLYDAERITIDFSNGEVIEYRTVKRQIYFTDMEWDKFLYKYSSPDTITFMTCYPRNSISPWVLVVEMRPVGVMRTGSMNQKVPHPDRCRTPIFFFDILIG